MAKTVKNTPYIIKIEAPLLRPGMSITIGPVSEKYIVEETKKAMDFVRQINTTENENG